MHLLSCIHLLIIEILLIDFSLQFDVIIIQLVMYRLAF